MHPLVFFVTSKNMSNWIVFDLTFLQCMKRWSFTRSKAVERDQGETTSYVSLLRYPDISRKSCEACTPGRTQKKKITASSEDWTHDPWFTRPVLCHWAIEADCNMCCNTGLSLKHIQHSKGLTDGASKKMKLQWGMKSATVLLGFKISNYFRKVQLIIVSTCYVLKPGPRRVT